MYQPVRLYGAPNRNHSVLPLCFCFFALLATVFCVVGLVQILRSQTEFRQLFQPATEDVESAFQKFTEEYGKDYATPAEERSRFKIFAENYRRINEFNRENAGSTVGVNEFADLSDEEFEMTYLNAAGAPPQCTVTKEHLRVPEYEEPSEPISVNWVEKGKVVPVKNQGSCGSCWTFAATSVTETLYAIRENPKELTRLAEQQIVDCCRASRDVTKAVCPAGNGCRGGIVGQGLDYIRFKGQAKSDDYPYKARDGVCQEDKVKPFFKLDGYANITAGDRATMEKVVIGRSFAVGVSAGQTAFRYYKTGIVLTPKCPGNPINHGVTVVGAGTEGGVDYWLVRNSWGERWGAAGYIKIARAVGSNDLGACGIASCPQYALYKEDKA